MKTNRIVSRSAASSLSLLERVKLEAQITDDKADKTEIKPLRSDWSFDAFRNATPWSRYLFDFLGPIEGRTILDLGCGVHPTPIYFALAGAARVEACDISPKAIAYVERMAEVCGVADRVSARIGAGEELPYENEQFDLIHGEAVLHHLQLNRAGPEIARVMKQGGRGGFKDPLGQNRLFELARDYLPYRGKSQAKATDRPLEFGNVREFGQHFTSYTYRGFGLISSIGVLAAWRRDSWIEHMLYPLDDAALRVASFLQRYCRFVVTGVQK